ncbi:MAG: restriction endonuclease [Rhodocyclales bacterium]|nr:restriction endonuclease [Rhodocyclales bacterium]
MDVETELGKAVKHFWKTRTHQKKRQGAETGRKDAGNRGAVTGGKHADGFVNLIAGIVRDAGLPDAAIFTTQKTQRTLPGFFRPTKEWDLVIVSGSDLVGAIEVKSQVGSFGNNFNNRVEEALGNATDFWTAYKKGVFKPSQKPWLGYLFMLEEDEKSVRSTQRIDLKPFGVDEAFQERSYAKRYELVCERLVRELLYDAACFFTSSAKTGIRGAYDQPNEELSIRNFAISLHARAAAFAKLQRK